MDKFAGRTVLITGGGSGIGYEMARRFREAGAQVYAGDLDIAGIPSDTQGIHIDVTDESSVATAIAQVLQQTGRIDVLCNNAGIGSTRDPVTCSMAEWDAVFAVNARGVFLGTKYVLPSMLERGYGVIINTASVAGKVGLRDRTAYCASKGAVIALTKQVAVQYAGTGIRCNSICPGTVDSPWVGRLLAQSDDPIAARLDLANRQPMGRLGTPAEIAAAAIYLASDEASFITGIDLDIDGGLVAG